MTTRGKCPHCGYRVRLRKDGSPQTHRLYAGNRWTWLCPPECNKGRDTIYLYAATERT